jgi:hypothetical protein
MFRYIKEFNSNFKTGDKIKVQIKRYDANTHIPPPYKHELSTAFYTIGKTDLDTAQGQVELICGDKTMVVEYQWFDEELTTRKISKIIQ